MRDRSRPARCPDRIARRSTTSCCASRKTWARSPTIRGAMHSINWARTEGDAAGMKLLALILVGFVIALQYPLWFGKGGWLRVRDLQQQVDAQKSVTAKME